MVASLKILQNLFKNLAFLAFSCSNVLTHYLYVATLFICYYFGCEDTKIFAPGGRNMAKIIINGERELKKKVVTLHTESEISMIDMKRT